MTPRERFKAFKEGRDIDRIPISPFMGEPCAEYFGVNIREYSLSAKY